MDENKNLEEKTSSKEVAVLPDLCVWRYIMENHKCKSFSHFISCKEGEFDYCSGYNTGCLRYQSFTKLQEYVKELFEINNTEK